MPRPNTLRYPVVALLALALGSGGAAAEQPDINHGRGIATQGVDGGRTPPCAQCHGENGIGDGSGAFPRLTGQVGFYLYKQLRDFAAGTRESQVMQPIAKALSDKDMQDIAGYFEAQKGPFFPQPATEAAVLQRGGAVAASGLPDKNIPACFTCHGQAGHGQPPSFPTLAGQYAPYLQYQLDQFRTGARRNSPMNVMSQIAVKLSDEDTTTVASYFASVRPPCACGDVQVQAPSPGAAAATTGDRQGSSGSSQP